MSESLLSPLSPVALEAPAGPLCHSCQIGVHDSIYADICHRRQPCRCNCIHKPKEKTEIL